ncbi:hypothetical protein EMCG_09096, partial [[Emmonsia] crescens]
IMSSSANPTPATEPIDDEHAIEKGKTRATDLINTAAYTKAELLDQVTYLFAHKSYAEDDPRVITKSRQIINNLWQERLGEEAAWPA